MAKYSVTIPVAGHLFIEVEAENAEAARDKAFEEAGQEHLEDWEALESFNTGNVCHCPSPWELTIVNQDTGEEERA